MKKINRIDDKQQLGDIEGEDQQMKDLIKRETQRPITFKQDNQLDPENPSWSAGSEEESFDFHRQDEERRKALLQQKLTRKTPVHSTYKSTYKPKQTGT